MTKEQRAAKWEAEFIACRTHITRRCNKSFYVNSRSRRCGTCKNNKHLPAFKQRWKRWAKTSNKRKEYNSWYQPLYRESEARHSSTAWFQERRLHGSG